VFDKGDAKLSEELSSHINRAIAERESKSRRDIDESAISMNIRKILVDEIGKYSSVKERIIQIAHERSYELIKPLIGYKQEIENQLVRFSFSKNVFLMMKFRDSNKDLSEYIIENLSKHGLRGVRADHDEWNITNNVYNPLAVLYCCKYGIALFDEPEEHQAYSPNVAYELGMMHYQNKPCLILRHSSLPSLPFDLVKDLYLTYERDLQVKQIIASWIKQVAAIGDTNDA
jgi:hypothetical protein